MKKIIFISMILLLLFSTFSFAGNWYVRPNGGSYGSENGTNWSNAYDGFSDISWGSVSCGDTIWIAGGTYTQDLVPAKNCTSGSQLYIRRARSDASECTGATGWSSGFDSTVEMYRHSITFGSYNWITVSGRTISTGGNLGWLINFPSVSSGIGVEWPNGSNGSDIKLEYMEIRGPNTSNTAYAFTNDGRGVDDTPFSSATRHTFSHMKIWAWESPFYLGGTAYHTSEYVEILYTKSNGVQHPNIYYIIGSSNGIIRYSKIHDNSASGTGVAFSDGGPWNNWQIYGNLFYDNSSSSGAAINIQESAAAGMKIFNNTFINNGMNLYLSGGGSCGSGSENRNNLFYGTGGTLSCGTASNNVTTTTSAFINYASKDFHIVSNTGGSYPRNAGTSLSSYFTTDLDGVTFGGDGTWDVGAYEYDSGEPGDTTAPTTTITTQDQNIPVDRITVVGTCTDDTACTSVKWRIGSDPDATHGTACTGTSSWSCDVTGLSSGANEIYVEGGDAAGNWDTENSITATLVFAGLNGAYNLTVTTP